MIVQADTEEIFMNKATIGLLRVANRLEENQLALAPQKTEVERLTKRRKFSRVVFEVEGVTSNQQLPSDTWRVWLDTKLNFPVT